MDTPADRMLVAGAYDFSAGGVVKISLQYRDQESKLYNETWDGTWHMLEPTRVEVNLIGSHAEIFEELGSDRLSRVSTTADRRVWEKDVVLLKQR